MSSAIDTLRPPTAPTAPPAGAAAATGALSRAGGGARVGPNTVRQTVAAMRRRLGSEETAAVLATAALADPAPEEMVDEGEFARLVTALLAQVGPATAAAVLADAGTGTGRYLLRHRIPALAQRVFRALPRRWSLRLLLRAIAAHAWTFAGSAPFTHRMTPTGAGFSLAPCRTCAVAPAGEPLGGYYARAVETLVHALVDPAARVTEVACVAAGAPACRFAITLPSRSPREPVEVPCASS